MPVLAAIKASNVGPKDVEGRRRLVAELLKLLPEGLSSSEIQANHVQSRRRDIFESGLLADKLRKQPAGDFCPWGGLNPRIGGACAKCRFEADCSHFEVRG